ncbi:TetR/AcrR family transcriptional regulator [Mesorhizobium microcysteis]|uniref:TetR/AcrR family transcriptional regulator n=1 Tax=Neoaquamicrobium microcysteis TaxID=2682781 RepID=A0A5D4GQE0_9HYPH|nr:TetR/AcrR family transcriptional regulator [Mesorhizobium microcysteis]TYR30548.1 TetR/AcrR family transcriptional regulator [Mesorhizobium microcysteis]
MGTQIALKDYGDFSMEGLCAAILVKHQDAVRVRNPRIAVAKLAKIVDTILTLSNRQGFHATSLREISTASGVSMGGLYAYFDSKDTLLMMILGQVSSSVHEVFAAAPVEVRLDPASHLKWLVTAHVMLTETMLPWFAFAFMEAKSFPKEGRRAAVASEEAIEHMFTQVLEAGAKEGRFVTDDPRFVAALIKPMLQDWYVKRAKWRRRGLSASDYAQKLCAFLDAAVGKPGRPGD